MRIVFLSCLLVVGLGATRDACAQHYGNAGENGTVRCESGDGRTRQCPADTRGGVRLERQASRAPCIQGDTWGYGPAGIWVARGCRGEFLLGEGDDGYGPGYGGLRTFRCESRRGRVEHCAVSTRGGVRLARQLSRGACVEGSTWGYDRGGLWVAQGCRAEFEIDDGGYGNGWSNGYDGYGGPQSVRCESGDGRGKRCGLRVWRGVDLARQLSRAPCIEGQSWGWDHRGIWVSNGCRAEFNVW